MKPPESEDRSRPEWLAVAALTAIGFGLRSWPIGQLGLNHFDEGIYALVASWSLGPKGLAGLDPMLIPYAPPGYPILGGLASWLLGRSDGAMIAVSQVAGTLTIPVVAWLGRRTFGPGAGFASATFCAFSGPHIAFSRMALTDVSFLLAWLIAIGAGMRFLERPGMVRAILMGLAVGLAQQFKYNGWLSGGIVVASAVWGIFVSPDERRVSAILKTFGWGILAAGVAWLVAWPWYAFVEAHGGYAALLRHQRSYLGGFGDWWPNLLIQMDQAAALSGDGWIVVPALSVLGLGLLVIDPQAWRPLLPDFAKAGRLAGISFCILTEVFFYDSPHKLGLLIAPFALFGATSTRRLVGMSWMVLALLTPFYHPYARLWLPIQAVQWLLLGWLMTCGVGVILTRRLGVESWSRFERLRKFMRTESGVLLMFMVGILYAKIGRLESGHFGLLGPSDLLYQATIRVSEILPKEVQGLRLLVRPPVTYYLAGRVALYPMDGSDQLQKRSNPRVWALVDSTILRSEPGGISGWSEHNLPDRFAKDWEVVETIPTNPSFPTLLDLDPTTATSTGGDRTYPLWLLRPRTAKVRR
jgi:dolichyl-phosphate-mannose-protein mannosyltransferase